MFSLVHLRRGLFSVACTLAAVPVQAGLTLDSTFDEDGFALVNFADNLDGARDVAIDGDGSAVLVGLSRQGGFDHVGIARVLGTGALDTGFGTDGLVTLLPGGTPQPFGGGDGRAVAIQPADGKIVVAGSWNDNTGSGFEIFVLRLLPDGSPDGDFGDAGVVILSFPEVLGATAEAVALDDEGRILVAGGSNQAGTVRGFVLRLTAAGDPDDTFAGDGLFTMANPETPGTPMVLKTVQQLAGGKILAAGGTGDLIVVRLTADGAPDPTFSGDGVAMVNVSQQVINTFTIKSYEDTYACAVQPDGRILVGGSTMTNSAKAVLARFTSTGALDASFGNGGLYPLPGAANNSAVYDIALRDHGDFVVAGLNIPPTQVSVNASVNSKLSAAFPPQAINGLVTLEDGRVVGAGEQNISGANYQFVAMRLGATNLVDPDCTACGELSGDCRITSTDAVLALKMAVGQLPEDPQADMDASGSVSASDALRILRQAVGSAEPTEACKN
jgi:uncharacterized delta-60 repeat protein